ncbi:MAG: type II secretion system protein GspJ [Candidatus Omnitrophota bacterium]
MRNKKAFTLMELLITVSIFAVITVTIYSGFHTGVFGYRNIEEALAIHQAARQALERVAMDLRNSFSFKSDESRFNGAANELSFLTLVDTFYEDGMHPEFSFVSYALTENRLMRLCRKNKESLKENSEVTAEELAVAVRALTFSYGYAEGEGASLQWKELWDDPAVMPAAVKIKLTIGKDDAAKEFERTIYLPSV